jgi:aspartate-semialdehyde dehydrogenase
MMPTFRIGIAGAASPLGGELKELLAESSFAGAQFLLMDDAEAHGRLDQIGDEAAVVFALGNDSFDGLDFVFFVGTKEQTQRWWRVALGSGATVLDMTGVLEGEPEAFIHCPWLETAQSEPDLLTRAVVPAHPAALALALLLGRLHAQGLLRSAAATVLHPASEFGAAGLDELHRQTVGLLSFQSVPQELFEAQVGFNQLVELGESARVSLLGIERRICQHLFALAPRAEIAVQMVQAPVFHGLCFSVWVELTEAIPRAAIEQALSGDHLERMTEASESPSNLAASAQNHLLIRIRSASGDDSGAENLRRFWLWAACDNLRFAAQNAVDCALALRRFRPQGQVQ